MKTADCTNALRNRQSTVIEDAECLQPSLSAESIHKEMISDGDSFSKEPLAIRALNLFFLIELLLKDRRKLHQIVQNQTAHAKLLPQLLAIRARRFRALRHYHVARTDGCQPLADINAYSKMDCSPVVQSRFDSRH